MQSIETRGLSAGSLYKILLIGLLIPLFVFGLGCGIASLLGHSTVSFNGHYIYGVKGLIGGIILGFALPVIFSSLLWCLMVIGIWLWTRMRTITIRLKY